jgi:hypothetical protein
MMKMTGISGLYKNTKGAKKIKDSGDRTEFESGAVRDMREGKGRCDLLPLDVISELFPNCDWYDVFTRIDDFQNTNDLKCLKLALDCFNEQIGWNIHTMILEVAKQFEEGAEKYGENNWRKGIPVRCYIDSAIRHYLKWLRGDQDEPHDRAFCWNILCAMWTCKNKPELNDYRKEDGEKCE